MHFTLCDFVLDVTQNAVEARSSRIVLDISEGSGLFAVSVSDNGKGMSKEECLRATDPFYSDGIKHVHRKVGLGLPFLIQGVEQCGGNWSLESEKGKGTTLTFAFPLDHVDTPPVGDVAGMLVTLLSQDGEFELIVNRSCTVDPRSVTEYTLRRSELAEVLGDLTEVGSLSLLSEYIRSQELPDEPGGQCE